MKRFSHASGNELAPADLTEAIETTLEVSRNEYKYVADLVADLGELPPVTCIVGEINQVLLNLAITPRKPSRKRTDVTRERGEIRISTHRDGDHVVIAITDDGPGIPPEIADRIYEPFFPTKEIGKGTGQGLALARTAIERHGGSLQCDSAVGEGTTFTIRLPIEPPCDPKSETTGHLHLNVAAP